MTLCVPVGPSSSASGTDPRTSANRAVNSISAPPFALISWPSQKSQYRGFFANGFLPSNRSRGTSGPLKGTAQSSQRGERGSLLQTARRDRAAGSPPMRYVRQRSSFPVWIWSITPRYAQALDRARHALLSEASRHSTLAGATAPGSHEELKPGQSFVKL